MKPPPLPAACHPLGHEDYQRLKAARPRLWTDPQRTCLICCKQNDSTYRWWDGPREKIVTYECACTDQWLLHLWLLNAGIGLNYQRLGWEDVTAVPSHVADAVMDYALDAQRNVSAGRNLVLWSKQAGTGKTLLLTLLAKALLARSLQVHFSQFTDVIDLFTNSWRDVAEREQWNRRVRHADVLCIDDLGKEHRGRAEMVESMIDQIIRTRVADAAPTLATTNWSPEEIHQGYGGYVMSLLSETATFIEVTGSDFRPQRREMSLRETQDGLTRPITVV